MTFLAAVDGGGTSCRAAVADHRGARLGEGHAGSANVATDLIAARDNIVEAVGAAFREAGLPEAELAESSVVLGLAGANIGENPKRIAALLPFRVSHVETDARIALQGAVGDADGAVAVLGTGSVFIARSHGRIRTVGGWGPAIGDFCSGSRLGRTLLQEVLRAYDNLREASDLSRHVLARYNDDPGALVEFAQAAKPRDFAGFAPVLFDYAGRGDAIARDIVTDAVDHLQQTLGVLTDGEDLPFCLLGGLASSYAKQLSPSFGSRLRRPDGSALDGALAMAVAMFGEARGSMHIHG